MLLISNSRWGLTTCRGGGRWIKQAGEPRGRPLAKRGEGGLKKGSNAVSGLSTHPPTARPAAGPGPALRARGRAESRRPRADAPRAKLLIPHRAPISSSATLSSPPTALSFAATTLLWTRQPIQRPCFPNTRTPTRSTVTPPPASTPPTSPWPSCAPCAPASAAPTARTARTACGRWPS